MKKKKILKGIFYTVAAIVGFFGVNLLDIPGLPFVIIIICGIVYIVIHIIKLEIIKKAYKKKKKKLKNKAKKYNRTMRKKAIQTQNVDEKCEIIAQMINSSFDRNRYKANFVDHYNTQYKKTKYKVMISSGALLCICIFNFNYVTSFAQRIFVAIESIKSLDAEGTEQLSKVNSTSTPNTTPTQIPIQTSTPISEMISTSESALMIPTPKTEKIAVIDNNNQKGWIEFKLEYPKGYPKITNNEFNNLYNLIFYIDADDLDEALEKSINIWMNGYAVNTSLDNVINYQGKSAGYYSEIEDEFSNEDGRRLSSNLLDEIITGREELMDLYPNGTLSWLLANHNQTYALNYLYQTNNERSTLYFYMKSISYTQKSLEFEMDNKSKTERIEYIKFRYKDIAECSILDDQIRIRAYEILIAMDEVLNNPK